jgi:chromate transporter
MNGTPEPRTKQATKLGCAQLFMGFFEAGILGFGGVLPVARRLIVDERKWLSQAAFNDLFSLCQFLPGANIVNFAFAFGARNRGLAGAAAAVAGLLAAPLAIVLCLAGLYNRYGGIAIVQHGLRGLAAAAAGLVMGTALKIAVPIFRGPRQLGIAASVLGLVLLAHLSLPLTMLLTLPLSIALSWRA